MKFFIILYFLLVGVDALRLHMKVPDYIQKNKYYFGEKSYNSLIKNIESHKVKNLYFSEKLDTVISEDSDPHENKLEDYSITKINPFITDNLASLSVKNEVNTVFIDPGQPNIYIQAAGQIVSGIESLLFPGIVLSIIFSIVSSNMPMRTGPSGSPFLNLPGVRKDMNKDKEIMKAANISLQSFAGSPEIFEECTEVVSYLKNSTIYENAGAEIPRGILLEGPPGTGKTLLAKAIASEAEANFVSVAASEFVELFVGLGAVKIRNLFKSARENKPCIIFIDEIDAVGRQRGTASSMGGNEEREQTLNQLLAEMDGFADNKDILVIAATNRRDILDTALLRPGRFDRIINVPYPDIDSRKKILESYTKNKKFSPAVNLGLVAELTAGFSGAQLKNLLNEAAIFTARRGNTTITDVDILNSLDKLIVGIVKNTDSRDEHAKRRVAIHEAGHGILAAVFHNYFDLKKVSIQSTYNGAGGYTVFNEHRNITDSGLYTKDLLFKRLVIGMGGKAAENVYYGDADVSVGAVQDLKQTNSLAQRMIGNYGMGTTKLETFYNEDLDAARISSKYSDHTKEQLDDEALSLVNNAYIEAKKILRSNKEIVDLLVEKLLDQKILTGSEVRELLDHVSDDTEYDA